ncbi:TAP domain-containing protein [Rutstroemia sp. NJR-2017a WRK4]|nr:TAP domain-containing protein [Rutstroemia sp. NJR-2017a WRK4]
MQRSSAPPRGPRHGSSGGRGGGRGGGIAKRRAGGPTRIDKDGDLDMDAVTGANARKAGKPGVEGSIPTRPRADRRGGMKSTGRGGNLTMQRTQAAILRGMDSQQTNILVTLWVKGLKDSKAASNSDGGHQSLVQFLERKASSLDAKSNKTVKIKKSHMKGDTVIISAIPEDAATLLKLNGFSFAGATLSVEEKEPSSQGSGSTGQKGEISEEAQSIQDKIRQILSTRYDGNLKLLNLSALGQDEKLREMGIFDDRNLVSKLFPVLMVVCDKLFTSREAKKEAIVSITMTDNELPDVSNVTTLASTFPDLKNLDLSRNNFADLKSLRSWRWKFRHLENLVLTSNPIETLDPEYKTEIVRWYPELQFLNGVQVRSPAEIVAALEAIKTPIAISPPIFQDVGQVGENFVLQFFSAYDTDRNALLNGFYDSQSSFSLSVNMTAPRDRAHSMAVPPWAAYTKHNRNLAKFTRPHARSSRKYRGIQAIQPIWNELPATRHPDIATQPHQYLVECRPLPGLPDPTGQSATGVDGLQITVHGEFEEKNETFSDKPLRSFSRSFILGPGAPGGPPIRVISDLLTLRAWSPLVGSTPAVQPIQAPPPVAEVPATALTPEQQQQAVAAQLSQATGMNAQYAIMCLTETGWDLEKAFVAFTANKDKLPAEAFVTPN